MAQRSCCVPGCSMKLGGGLPLHRFPNPNNPAQVERFRTWVMKIGGDIIGEYNNFIHKNRKVCHKHFQDIYTLPNKKISALAIPTLAIPGVHVGERRHIEPPSTSLQMETAISTRPVPMDTDISSRPVMNIEMPLQMETAISTRPVQMDTAISSRPVMNIEMPLQMETAISTRPVQMDTLALQRKKIEARRKDMNTLGTGKEAESGGSGFISVDEVRMPKTKRGKIRNRERELNNRLRKIREGNSQREAQTVSCKGVRDRLQTREGETQRDKQSDAETCGQGTVRERETQREKSLPAPGPSGGNDRNRDEMTEDRHRTRQKRGKRSGFLRRVSLAQSTSEPQPGPSGQGAAKRERPDDTASPSTLQGDAKRVRTQAVQGEQRIYARATKDIPARLAVAICLSPPSRDMTTDEGEHIKLCLEYLIVETCRTDPSKVPAFRGYSRVADGTVHMWCEDDNALTWLTQNVPKIRLPNTDATLTVMKQSDVPTRVRAALFIPRYNGEIALLQTVLTCQNPWYDIGRWSLYRATSVGGDNYGTYLTLGIPPDEVEKVLGRERRISYLLGSIYVRFFPNTHPSDTKTDTERTKPAPTELDLTMTQLEEEMPRTAMADADAVRMPTSPPGWTEQLLSSSPALSEVQYGLKEGGESSDGSISS